MIKNIIAIILKIITSRFFLSIAIGIISYYGFFNKTFPMYKHTIIGIRNNEGNKTVAQDIDNDGESELILLSHVVDSKQHSFIMLHKSPPKFNIPHSQTNLNLNYVNNAPLIVEDIDNDSIKELFGFFLIDSSIYIQGFKYNSELYSNLEPISDLKKICRINITNNNFEDFVITDAVAFDINNDGFKDLIFHINGLYTAFPRITVIYDVKNDTIKTTSFDYRFSILGIEAVNSKISNRSYIIPNFVSTPMNIGDTSIKYHDRSSWVLAYDNNLHLLFDPIELGSGYSNTNFQKYYSKDSVEGIISLALYDSTSVLTLYSFTGDTINSRTFDGIFNIYNSVNNKKYLCTIQKDQFIYFIDYDLKIASKKRLSKYNSQIMYLQLIDIDEDEKLEYFFVDDHKSRLELVDDNFCPIFSISGIDFGFYPKISKINSKKDGHFLLISTKDKAIILKYHYNSYYILSFLIPSIIALIFFFLITIAIKQREKTIEHRNQQEKDLIESQLKIANKQLSPHFQLNILNSISYLFERDKDKAQYYMGKYSRLVTETMMNVDKLETTIDNEIQFTKNYLILEQLRLNNKFDFDFEIDENINLELKIPRMAIFTFCENAVKHGLFHLKQKGNLWINLSKLSNNEIKIIIEDNGIGRQKSIELHTNGTGMGIKTLEHIFSHFEKFKKTKIKYNLNDKPNNEGLIVEISIVFNEIK